MAIDNILQVFNEEGQSVDYDILASDVKFLPDGKDLPTKLAEMQDDIDQAGQGDGTVTGVKVGSDTYEPTEGVVDLSTPFNAKVDKVDGKGLSKNDYTDADKAKVDNLKTVATSGSYNDLTDKPVIPEGATPDQSLDPNSDNAVSNAAVCAGLSTKANSSDLQNYATKNELTSGLSSKQDTLTFDTTPTAGHATQVMSSDSIKTAIDLVTPTIDANGKWVIGGVTTTHDAHGPMGNITIEDGEDMVALIVNDLTTGGQANFLSAEMGKALLSVLLQIFGNLGNYAFPNGKPTLNFNTQISFPISYSTSDEHVTYADGQGGTAPTTVDLLGRLEIQLGTNNDLYVIKESAVKVFVGGTEVSGAYDPTTDKIIIPEVYGNVVIIAEAWTYVQDGLVLHLDGKNRGDVAGHWKSLVNYNNGQGFNDKIDFTLTNCDETHSDYVAFDGDPNGNDTGSKAIANISLLDVSALTGTIEAGYANAELNSAGGLCVMHNALGSGNRICLSSWRSSSDAAGYNRFLLSTSPVDNNNNNTGVLTQQSNVTGGGFYSFVLESYKRNGSDIPGTLGQYTQTSVSGHSILSLFWRKTAADNVQYSKGRLYSLRVYSVQLDDDERARNLAIDQKRFNLA